MVICDLRMPGLSGMQLHDTVRERAPQLLPRLLFLTGDVTSTDASEFRARCAAPIVGKPFVGAELVRHVLAVVRTSTG